MAKLIDCDIEKFLRYSNNKKLFVIGTGRIFVKFFQYFNLSEQVALIMDNDEKKHGLTIELGKRDIIISDIDDLVGKFDGSQLIVITNLSSLLPIMEQLNEYPALYDAECFHATMMMDRCKKEQVEFLSSEMIIPKTIHYCWFGNHPIPDEYKKCIESWSNYCPDYEIIQWNESNYDITKNGYMKEAYDRGRWGFVPDYARLDIVYENGGVYLDTDIEMLRKYDELRREKCFFGFHNYVEITPGLGFGAVPKHPFIKELMEVYSDKHFIKDDGSNNETTCITYSQPVFEKHGFEFNNTMQRRDNVTVFPVEVLNPTGALGMNDLYTENTFSFNHSARSWDTRDNHRDYDRIKAREWEKFL